MDTLTTAKNLGYDILEPDNMLKAGAMLLQSLDVPTTIDQYLAKASTVLSADVAEFLHQNRDKLDPLLTPLLDYDWFSANTFVNNYLLRINERVVESVPLCLLRVAVQLYHNDGVEQVAKCYRQLARRYYVPASPCFFNAGTTKPQMSSCFLHSVGDDTQSITDNWHNLAFTSKHNGGNGVDLSLIRHSEIGMAGMSKGVIPIARTINSIIRFFDQGGKRKGTATLFLRPHHIDVYEFCELGLKTGDIYARAHDVNIALWCSWLFFWRVRRDEQWTLFCPNYAQQLNHCYGAEFNKLYVELESKDMPPHAKRVVKARDLFRHIVSCQTKSSMPYILHGDACNIKSNQRYMGYIPCSNLCLEVIEFSSPDKIASCNLSSISLRAFASPSGFDYQELGHIARSVTRNVDRMIDYNWYPIDKIKDDNAKDRPLAIGVSGFAEMLHELDLAFEDQDTLKLNKMVFACIYFNALVESVQLAIETQPHHDFHKSPLAQGMFQFDLWAQEYRLLKELDMAPLEHIRKESDDIPVDPLSWGQKTIKLSNGYLVEPNWQSLRVAIKTFGVRNSLLIGLMPTGTSSQVLMNAETTEAHRGNIYSRKLDKGAYPVVNRYMVADLKRLGLWNAHTVRLIQGNNGSIASLPFTVRTHPQLFQFNDDYRRLKHVVNKYKTMYEISQKVILKLAADRGRYICQSQSSNIYIADPTIEQLTAVHMYAMMLGLKTGMYYLRTDPASEPMKFCLSCS